MKQKLIAPPYFSPAICVIMLCALYIIFFPLSSSSTETDDNRIVPGKRVGFITKQTTEGELITKLSAKNVVRASYICGEATLCCAVKLYSDSPKELFLLWGNTPRLQSDGSVEWSVFQKQVDQQCQDTEPQSLWSIIIGTPYWETAEGVKVTTTLHALEQGNAAPVVVSPCLSNHDGVVLDWSDGKLAKSNFARTMKLTLMYGQSDASCADLDKKITAWVGGILSDQLPMPMKLNMVVDEISFVFDE